MQVVRASSELKASVRTAYLSVRIRIKAEVGTIFRSVETIVLRLLNLPTVPYFIDGRYDNLIEIGGLCRLCLIFVGSQCARYILAGRQIDRECICNSDLSFPRDDKIGSGDLKTHLMELALIINCRSFEPVINAAFVILFGFRDQG